MFSPLSHQKERVQVKDHPRSTPQGACVSCTVEKQRERMTTNTYPRKSALLHSPAFKGAPEPCRQRDIKSTPVTSRSLGLPELRLCWAWAGQGPSPQRVLSSRSSVQVCEKVLITERAAATAQRRHFCPLQSSAAAPRIQGHGQDLNPPAPTSKPSLTRSSMLRSLDLKNNANIQHTYRTPWKNGTEGLPRDT